MSTNSSKASSSSVSSTSISTSLALAEDAAACGLATVDKLNLQTEHLRSAEDTLEANEHIVDKAMKTVRGMTWTGMFYNMISGDRQSNVSHRNDTTTGRKTITTTTSTPSSSSSSSSSGQRHHNEQLMGTSSSSSSSSDDKKELDMLLTSVTQLHDISLSLGQKIEQQNATLERMEEKAIRVNDQTLAVTLKASQLTQRSSGSKEIFVGYYQFVDDETHALLSVNAEGSLVLVETPERSTVFKCYVKGGTLYALQSDKSLRYISSTIWGPIRAVSTSFGKREECHLMSLDDDRCTGIFYPNTNWGAGGWLKQSIVDSCVLDQVTHGIADKQGMILFWPVCLGTNEDIPYQEPKKERRTKAF